MLTTDPPTDRINTTFNQQIQTFISVFCSHDEIQHHYDFLVICGSFWKNFFAYNTEQIFFLYTEKNVGLFSLVNLLELSKYLGVN
jgi:hypothetical protein